MKTTEGTQDEKIVKYFSYDELKETKTRPNDRPSYTPRATPSDEATKMDKLLALKFPEYIPKSAWNRTLFHANHVRSHLPCQACGRERLIYAFPLPHPEVAETHLPDLHSVLQEPGYDYQCGDALFGMQENEFTKPPGTQIFHVKQAMTCAIEIQRAYFTCKKKFDDICIKCGDSQDLLDAMETHKYTEGVLPFPICRGCFDNGEEEDLHGIKLRGRAKKTSTDKKRTRGASHSSKKTGGEIPPSRGKRKE
jgi:hypothetical protein